ncbi:MAG: SGNH/GDSL hydrolase family protein [Candidatus Rokubacteria bacterium]|nr:SGNH/GDSL hydrolase family protein [Candidatus Rokubacteria bacterium]
MRGRRLLVRTALVVLSVLLILGVLEVVLRLHPTLLGTTFANGALSRYSTRRGGIYYHDANLGMNFMIPNYSAVMYANGYTWHHRTDALGFRNDVLHVPADIMLLGDSLVYGHGVEFADTIAANLERRTGRSVANLGRQGDCTFQEAYLLTAYLPVYRSRIVVHVFTANDILDAYTYLSDAAMEQFIATPVGRITFPPRQDVGEALRAREERLRRRGWWKRIEDDAYVVKMYRWMLYMSRDWRALVVAPAWAATRPREFDMPFPEYAENGRSLGWRYTEHALAYMNHAAGRHGARFYTASTAVGRQEQNLRAIARRHGIAFIDMTPARTGAWGLPGDDHLSPLGARQFADVIAQRIERDAERRIAGGAAGTPR